MSCFQFAKDEMRGVQSSGMQHTWTINSGSVRAVTVSFF